MNAEYLAMVCVKEFQVTCRSGTRTPKSKIQKETKENFIKFCPLQ
jgi:hypothetical protein